jgi:cyclophilin family peptidyl-prolyl cis-trans isomerase
MQKDQLIVLGTILVVVILGFFAFKKAGSDTSINYQPQKETQAMPATLSANKKLTPPEMIIQQNGEYTVTLHTSEGDIVIRLHNAETPITANNFFALAKQGFYDGTIFHRVIDGFMIQGGDPRGDGTGDPGYKFADESFNAEYTRGTVAMANSGPNTNGSQFFIMHKDYPLPPNYTIFGTVVEGLEVVDAIATAQVTGSFSGEMSRPVTPVVVEKASVSGE